MGRELPAPARSPLRRALLRLDAVLRVIGALAGSLLVAVLIAAVLAAYLPLSASVRFPIALLLSVPLWVGAMCAAFLTPRGWQVWLAIAALTVLLSPLIPW